MSDKKIKVAIIGGMYGFGAAMRNSGVDVVAASYEIINLKNAMEASLPPRGKGKGDRIRRRQQWNRK